MAQKTIALYQKDSSLHTHATTVSSITPLTSLAAETQSLFKAAPDAEHEPFVVTTPETIFHAQGGGQPSDTGCIVLSLHGAVKDEHVAGEEEPVFHVHAVRACPPAILHMGIFHPASSRFDEHASVIQHIDPEPRLLHSRLHTGGHALGVAVMSLLSSGPESGLPADLREGKASHTPGTASVEFFGLIPGTAKSAIQAAVDALIARDLPVSIHFVSEAEALERCGAVAEGVKGDPDDGVRVVDIEGAGSYPCGGTHVKRLGEVGRVLVKGIKRQKGVSKVSYEVVDS